MYATIIIMLPVSPTRGNIESFRLLFPPVPRELEVLGHGIMLGALLPRASVTEHSAIECQNIRETPREVRPRCKRKSERRTSLLVHVDASIAPQPSGGEL